MSRRIIEFNLKNVEDVFEQERPEYITLIKALCLVNKQSKSLYNNILEAFHPGVGKKRHEAYEQIRDDLKRKIAYYENLKTYHERLKITLQILDDYEKIGYVNLDELDNFDLDEFRMDTIYTREGIRGLNILNIVEKMDMSDFCEEPTEIYEADEREDFYSYQDYEYDYDDYGIDYDEEESEFGRIEPYEGHDMYDYYHDEYFVEDLVLSLNDYLFKLIQKAIFGGDINPDSFECKYEYFSFGKYPKNIITDEELNNALLSVKPGVEGFIEHNGEKFYRVKAVLPNDREDWEYKDVRLSNGEEIQFGKIYHLSVDPIKWRILEDNNNEFILHSEEIIDMVAFDNNTNSYERSAIRKYLNETFFESAFDSQEQNEIQANYLEDIESFEKIFLLSTFEYDFVKYRMFSRDSRQLKTTDFVTLKYMVPNVDCYWTRTSMPDSDNDKAYDGVVFERHKDSVFTVYNGRFYFKDPKDDNGLAPVIKVKKK